MRRWIESGDRMREPIAGTYNNGGEARAGDEARGVPMSEIERMIREILATTGKRYTFDELNVLPTTKLRQILAKESK